MLQFLISCSGGLRAATRFIAFAAGFAAAVGAAEESSGGRAPAQAPQAAQFANDVPAGYRAAIEAHNARYKELYANADFTNALAEARAGLALAEQAHQLQDEAEWLKATLYVSWLLGLSSPGLEYGQRLRALAEQFDDDRLRSYTHRLLGTILRQLDNRAKAREHMQLALTFAERAGDAHLRIAALNNLGNLALDDGDLATARKLHEEVLVYREKNNLRWDATGSLTNLADVAVKAGELPRALELYERALVMRTEFGDQRGQVRSLREVASVLRQLGRPAEALARAAEARVRAEKIGGHELLGAVYGELALVHESRGEFAEALSVERLAAREREALASERARLQAAELDARFELARKQRLIDSLDRDKQIQAAALHARDADLSRARWQRYGLLGVLALGAIAVAAVVSRQRLKTRTEGLLLAEAQTARAIAEEADRVKTRFLGIASHDVRTPLANIVTMVGDLRDRAPHVPPDPEVLDIIGVEAQRVSSLVQDLLDVAALEAGRLELTRTTVDLHAIVNEALVQYQRQAQAKRVALELSAPPAGDMLVDGDGRKLLQVATNLISNAIKFTPPGTKVGVSLGRDDDRIVLAVRDAGPGIAPADAERLCTPFKRLAAHPTAGESSHGFGLSIAHEILILHGGALRVQSQPGEGATFSAEIPAVSAAAPHG